MTTQKYINENKTASLKKGDKVVMHSCLEANLRKYKGKKWICQTDSFTDRSGQDVVFLKGFSGYFLTQYLVIIE